jgi:serine/threonine protein kinase
VIHRDIKPGIFFFKENILLKDQEDLNSIVLVDFGFGAQYESDSSINYFSK